MCMLPCAGWAQANPHQADGLSNVTVLIIRHAEKPAYGDGLSEDGQHRAAAYIHFFDPLRLNGQTLVPQRLIATSDSKSSQRPRLTLTPLAQQLHLPIEQQWSDGQANGLVEALRAKNNAPVVLIAWHHGQIPHLLSAFDAAPQALLGQRSWPGNVYNWLIVLHFDDHGKLLPEQSMRVQEHLLPGD